MKLAVGDGPRTRPRMLGAAVVWFALLASPFQLSPVRAADDSLKYFTLLEGAGHRSVCFSIDGSKILTAGDADVQVWDAKTFKAIGQPIALGGGVKFARFDTAADKVLVLRNDAHFSHEEHRLRTTTGEVTLHDATTGNRLVPAFLQDGRSVADADVSPDGSLVATCNEMDDTVLVWDAATGKQRTALKHDKRVKGLRFAPSGKALLVWAGTTDVLWNVKTWQQKAQFVGNPFSYFGGAPAVAFSADGGRVAVITDKVFTVYDTETGGKLVDNEGQNDLHLDEVMVGVAMSADGSRVVTTSTRGLMLWNARDGKPLLPSEDYMYECTPAVSPDGSHLLTQDDKFKPILLDVASGRRTEFPPNSGVDDRVASFSPDGKTLAVGTYDGNTAIYSVK